MFSLLYARKLHGRLRAISQQQQSTSREKIRVGGPCPITVHCPYIGLKFEIIDLTKDPSENTAYRLPVYLLPIPMKSTVLNEETLMVFTGTDL